MTEAEWLTCTDPAPMLAFLQGQASDRKLRLFAAACCRHVWHLLADERGRRAVEVTERYADRLATGAELAAAEAAAKEAYPPGGPAWDAPCAAWMAAWGAADAAARGASWQAAQAADTHAAQVFAGVAAPDAGRRAARAAHAALLRDLFGDPFLPTPFDPSWLAWDGGAIRNLARGIYEERAFDRLPILGDALEEAGCDSGDILGHCRQPGEHARGCWLLDLLLGQG
jgi:hypothetical protein